MTPIKRAKALARALLHRVPGARVLWQAMRNYVMHQSGTQAGSVAFSSLLAMFPLLILASAAAAYFGSPGDAAALAMKVLGYAPPVVRDALQPVVNEVIGRRNEALVAIGLFVTLWTGSSGMQAIRTALNRGYGVTGGAPFWMARLKVTAFTIVAGGGVLLAFSSVVVMPYVWQLLAEHAGAGLDTYWTHLGVRYGSAFIVVSMLFALLYGWLPDIQQQLRTVLPGALVGALLWVAAAALLSQALRSAGKLALVYGSFAGTVATLMFLYASAATLIFGAEVNGALREQGRKADEAAKAGAAGTAGEARAVGAAGAVDQTAPVDSAARQRAADPGYAALHPDG